MSPVRKPECADNSRRPLSALWQGRSPGKSREVALAELHHLIEKQDRAPGGARIFFYRTNAGRKNAAVILLTAPRLDGLVRGCAGRNAGSPQREDVPETRQ